jgi:hypothetical protein
MNTLTNIDASELRRVDLLARTRQRQIALDDETALRLGRCRVEHLLDQLVHPPEPFAEIAAEI